MASIEETETGKVAEPQGRPVTSPPSPSSTVQSLCCPVSTSINPRARNLAHSNPAAHGSKTGIADTEDIGPAPIPPAIIIHRMQKEKKAGIELSANNCFAAPRLEVEPALGDPDRPIEIAIATPARAPEVVLQIRKSLSQARRKAHQTRKASSSTQQLAHRSAHAIASRRMTRMSFALVKVGPGT